MRNLYRLFVLSTILVFVGGCKKFVTVPPPSTQLSGATVYSSNTTAAAAVSGIFQTMYNTSISGNSYGISALFGLAADEFDLFPTADETLNRVYQNDITSTTYIPFWEPYYNIVYQANSAINGIKVSVAVSEKMKKQLIGESKFARAFCYFYLTNTFGDVPIVTSTDFKINNSVARASKADVDQLILNDLKDARTTLSNDYLNPDGTFSSTKVRPNKAAVNALLARFYLYHQQWDSAEAMATEIISQPNFQLDATLNSSFLASNNAEAIWQLEAPNTGSNAPDGTFTSGYYYGGPASYYPFLLNTDLVNSFEPGDLRRSKWIVSSTIGTTTFYFPFKYKLLYTGQPPEEYPVVFRLAEQYLIRAEARAQQNNLSGAIADLNTIRNRAGLGNTIALTKQEVLNAILNERRHELFTEYGHRWFDLVRTGNADAVMSVVTPRKGGTWQSTDQLFPIPLTEIQSNPKLTQNPGY